MVIAVYRYGHRRARDKRVTTHLALVARAFGSDRMFIDQKDKILEEGIGKLKERFGNHFQIHTGRDYKTIIKKWDGIIVHLTMYGEKVTHVIDEIRTHENILILVGSQKVPGEFYQIADYNVSIGTQPHSEISALALFLHYLTKGTWIDKKFYGKYKIIPQKSGKKIVESDYVPLLEKEGCSKEVIQHSLKVQALAVKIAQKIKQNGKQVDIHTVALGALLHDIGRAKTHGIMHVVEGANIARDYGLPESVVSIIERHAGAGIAEEDAAGLGLPLKNYTPTTLEEEIVAHADNLTGKEYRNLHETTREFEEKAGKKAAKKIIALHKKLSTLCEMDIDELI